MKYWMEQFDQHDIGLIERDSDLPKYDVNNNLWKYNDQENHKDKKISVINGLLHFHGYIIQSYLKVYFIYIVFFYPQHAESVRQNQSIYVSVLLKLLTITTKNDVIINKLHRYGKIALHDNYREKERKITFSTD